MPRVRDPPHQVQAPHLGRTCGAPLPYSNTSCHEHTAGGCIRKTCVDRGLDRISRGLNTKLTVHIAEGRGSCYKLHGKNCCSDTLKANQKRVAAK